MSVVATAGLTACCSKSPWRALLLALFGFVLSGFCPAAAAATAVRGFDVPAGDAAVTLKQFSEQAEQQVVYMVDTVRGERTQAVRGDFTPAEALAQMLDSTRLVGVRDASTDALSVRRGVAMPPRPLPPAGNDAGAGAERPRASPVKTEEAADYPLTLSPFEVSSIRDRGFAAMSGVVGGRLAIDLKDSPASYSVLNNEFLDALQLTGLEQAADWATNTTRVPDQGNENTFGGAVLVAIRGVSGFYGQRDFFPMEMDFDSYNLDRLDYGRGPNAVLFGFASFSGTQNVVSKQARRDKDFGEVRLSYGSWDNRRGTFDLNYRLGPRAAVRLNGLAQERNGWRELEHEKKQALHLAGKFQLTPRTELRGELETGKFRQNSPYASGYYDGILGWNGTYVYDARQATPANAAALGVTSYGALANNVNSFVYSPSQNGLSVIDVMGTGRTTTAQNGGTIGGMPVTGAANSFAGVTIDELRNAPADRYARAESVSFFSIPADDHSFGLTPQDFTGRDYRVASIFLTHQIGDFYFEAAANYSINKRWALMTAQNGVTAYIDINRQLPNGQPNPMFLQPYTQGQLRRISDWWRKRNLRLSAARVMDNTRYGSFTFQGMVGGYYSDRPYLYDMFGVQRYADRANWAQSSELVDYRQYWNVGQEFSPPPVANYVDTGGTSQTVGTGWVSDQRQRGSQFKDGRETTFGQASVRGRWFENKLIGILSGRQDALTRRTWRNARSRDLIGTNWNGTDRVWQPLTDIETWTNLKYTPRDANGNPTGPQLPAIARPRDAQGFALAQYANDKFQDDYSGFPIRARVSSLFAGVVYHYRPWATLAASYSEGADFNDAPNRFDGSVFGQKTSRGIDVAVRSTFLEGKISTSLTFYKGREENQGFVGDPGVPWGSFNTIINANKLGDLSENGTNARSFAPLTSAGWDSRTTENHGVEFEAVANPTASWRLILNASLPRAVQTNNGADFRTYYTRNELALRSILADAGITIDALGQASVDPTVSPTLRAPGNEHQSAANAWNTLHTAYQSLVADAQDLKRLSTFIGNIYTDYTFSTGSLKGLKVGGGLNYRGKQVIGYRGSDTITDPTNPTVAIDDPRVGPHDSVYAAPYYMGVLELGYTWEAGKRYQFRVDCKVDNLFDWDRPIYIATAMLPPGGSLATPARVATPATYWRMTPRSFTLSLTTRF